MPRKKSSKKDPLKDTNVAKTSLSSTPGLEIPGPHRIEGIDRIKSLLDDEPTTSSKEIASSLSTNTAALHDELSMFRQKWKRELATKTTDTLESDNPLKTLNNKTTLLERFGQDSKPSQQTTSESKAQSQHETLKESFAALSRPPDDPKEVYKLAKRLFLIGVDLEHDEQHNESIRYYKQAMHLCPNIEKQIFREQLEASAMAAAKSNDRKPEDTENTDPELETKEDTDRLPLIDRIRENHVQDPKNISGSCRPCLKVKSDTLHISNLPHDLLVKLIYYIVGQDFDLASLEQFGVVCRGFYLLSNDQNVWRSICYNTWDQESFSSKDAAPYQINWKQVFTLKPRLNYDGVYISRTRYIRQGDVGFQDITYRPFHLIRYFRYMRFFPDRRVLVLTTNEEPERIIPIFRQANDAKHFSPELSILEGTYEFIQPNEIKILAEKEFLNVDQHEKASNRQNRQARFAWSRQTPLNQKFFMRFELETSRNRPYRNNTLRWCEYSISAKFEAGTEMTKFDLTQDSFPNLCFSRVKRFNLRSNEPLTSH